jgi:GNAT superfamily N-acetyltransferase
LGAHLFSDRPELRGRGLAGEFLKSVLAELKQHGVKRVQGYPKIDPSLPAHSQWTGPLGLYKQAGFHKIRDNKTRAVYELRL